MGKVTAEHYPNIRHRIQPGDVIAFGGRGLVSWIIRKWTRSPVSHVGIVSRVTTAGEAEDSVRVIESTSLDGYTGVVETRLSRRLAQYDGAIWWIPLSLDVRMRLSLPAFWKYVRETEEREVKYDYRGAFRSGLKRIGIRVRGECPSRLFCSELVAAALEAGGVIDSINSSAVTPRDLILFRLYTPEVYQIRGDLIDLPGLNSIDPEGFAE